MVSQEGSILVVEDDPEINELVGAYMELAGFHCHAALTGGEALRQVREHPPALIILDLMLPDVDGFELCRRIKSEPATRHIPVVILTALQRDDCRRRASECGASDYLSKPFDPDELMRSVRVNANSNGHLQ